MTDDEKRREKGNLLLTYTETVQNLACLRLKASRMAEPFRGVALWLKYIGDSEKKAIYGQEPAGRTLTNAEKLREGLDLDAVLAITEEINAAEDLLDDLRRRKQELGL